MKHPHRYLEKQQRPSSFGGPGLDHARSKASNPFFEDPHYSLSNKVGDGRFNLELEGKKVAATDTSPGL